MFSICSLRKKSWVSFQKHWVCAGATVLPVSLALSLCDFTWRDCLGEAARGEWLLSSGADTHLTREVRWKARMVLVWRYGVSWSDVDWHLTSDQMALRAKCHEANQWQPEGESITLEQIPVGLDQPIKDRRVSKWRTYIPRQIKHLVNKQHPPKHRWPQNLLFNPEPGKHGQSCVHHWDTTGRVRRILTMTVFFHCLWLSPTPTPLLYST